MHADSDARKGPRSSLGGAQTACAVFSRDGRCIYLGQSKGLPLRAGPGQPAVPGRRQGEAKPLSLR